MRTDTQQAQSTRHYIAAAHAKITLLERCLAWTQCPKCKAELRRQRKSARENLRQHEGKLKEVAGENALDELLDELEGDTALMGDAELDFLITQQRPTMTGDGRPMPGLSVAVLPLGGRWLALSRDGTVIAECDRESEAERAARATLQIKDKVRKRWDL